MSDETYSHDAAQEPEHDDLYATSDTPKLAGIFFGVAVLCAIFFAVGYRMGKGSVASASASMNTPVASAASAMPKPSAAHADDSAPEPAVPAGTANSSTPAKPAISSSRPTTHAAPEVARSGNFAVQVAAVSRQEDADALENALRSKSYPVFVVSAPGDKLFHVQVGPFSTLADAEAMKSRLSSDGYNPILKK